MWIGLQLDLCQKLMNKIKAAIIHKAFDFFLWLLIFQIPLTLD